MINCVLASLANKKYGPILLVLVILPLIPVIAPRASTTGTLVQVTAAGHVLVFQPDGIYVAGGDHLLHIGFIGTVGSTPQVDEFILSPDNVRLLSTATYTNLWPGIHLLHEAIDDGITRSTWKIEPGADASRIRLRYNGTLEIAGDGGLKISLGKGWMHESTPIAWQMVDGHRRPVTVTFSLMKDSGQETVVGFEVGQYDPNHALVIDPILTWHAPFGSDNGDNTANDEDVATGVALDGRGNVYVAGYSNAPWGSPLNAYVGGFDAFVAKLSINGDIYWNTFLGSDADDHVFALAVEMDGDIYVTGRSSATWGSPKVAFAGGSDAFVAKLDIDGNLQWSTFMGSSDHDRGSGIGFNSIGHVFVAGTSNASWGSPVAAHAGDWDAFVVKLDANGIRQWNTFLGSSGNDYGNAIAVSIDDVYVAGESWATWGSPVTPYAGANDAFAARLNSNGARVWNTFMGSSGRDVANSIAADDTSVYVTGESSSTWGSPRKGHLGSSYWGYSDAFVAKLNRDGNRAWNTFVGTTNHDTGRGIAVDKDANVYIAGRLDETRIYLAGWFLSIGYESYVTKLNPMGYELWTDLSASIEADNYATGVALDGSGNIYLAGLHVADRTSLNEPIFDAFAAKIFDDGCEFYPIEDPKGRTFVICL